MSRAYKPIFFGNTITIKSLRDYILDASLTDTDTILMHQVDFDELALEYHHTYNERLPEFYTLLGVLIKEGAKGIVSRNSIALIENDIESVREMPIEQVDTDRIIYRCGYCGNLVDENGGELDPDEFRSNANYLDKFGTQVTVHHEHGYCCEDQYSNEKTAQVFKSEINYSAVEGKLLMELTEDDFKQLGLDKHESLKFGVIYSCADDRYVKIYFTPNKDSYSQRGHLLQETEKIFTTEQFINTIKNWRVEKVIDLEAIKRMVADKLAK